MQYRNCEKDSKNVQASFSNPKCSWEVNEITIITVEPVEGPSGQKMSQGMTSRKCWYHRY